MAATTDYDAPRRNALDDDTDIESLDALTAARTDKQSPAVDLDETDTGESLELPGADLSGEDMTMPVVPQRADEFTCTSCFLLQHRSRLASRPDTPKICVDCA